MAIGVLRRPREQASCGTDPHLLLDDEALNLLVDRHQRFALHLVIHVAPVGGTFGVGHDALAREA
jgi:hypothetical protein